jgi:hypothetical protein
MPLENRVPKNSKLAIVGGIFKGVYGDPTTGKWDFTKYAVTGTRVNNAVDFGLKMRPHYLYFFHQMNFSLSIDEGDYLTAIDTGTVPVLTLRDSTSFKSIFNYPFRMFRYFENSAVDSYHYNLNANADLLGDFQCVLQQVANLLGVDTIFAQVSMSVYEISDEPFIDAYKSGK